MLREEPFQLEASALNWAFAVEWVTRIELALLTWEVCGAVSPSSADRLTCGCVYTLAVNDPLKVRDGSSARARSVHGNI